MNEKCRRQTMRLVRIEEQACFRLPKIVELDKRFKSMGRNVWVRSTRLKNWPHAAGEPSLKIEKWGRNKFISYFVSHSTLPEPAKI